MNIFFGIVMLLVSLVFGLNALSSASGRWGPYNKGRNILLAGSVATLVFLGAIFAFLSQMNVTLGLVVLSVGVYSGLAFINTVILRDTDILGSNNKAVVIGFLIVSITSFIGAYGLISNAFF